MTLQQLKYAITAADKGSINEAAKSLFLSQPSLSAAIRELEEEIGFALFVRTNRGIVASGDGVEFLGYARQVVQQAELLEEKYLSGDAPKQRFSVSTQHYAFTANAFVELIQQFGGDEYEFTLRETKTYDIIEDVKTLRSEMGVLYLSDYNEKIIGKLLRENQLVFTELFRVKPHIFVSRENPLARRKSAALSDLADLPCLIFEQGEPHSFYFAEEVYSALEPKKVIKVTDRAAIINLLVGLNAYNISTGVFPSYLHGDAIVAVPLQVEENIRVGVIRHRDMRPTPLGEIYLAALQRIARDVENAKREAGELL